MKQRSIADDDALFVEQGAWLWREEDHQGQIVGAHSRHEGIHHLALHLTPEATCFLSHLLE
jgi:hypothetical protein